MKSLWTTILTLLSVFEPLLGILVSATPTLELQKKTMHIRQQSVGILPNLIRVCVLSCHTSVFAFFHLILQLIRKKCQVFFAWKQWSFGLYFVLSRERQNYFNHQSKARKMPHKWTSVITDGMNSSKSNIPHFKVKSKVWKSLDMFLRFNLPWEVIADWVSKLLTPRMWWLLCRNKHIRFKTPVALQLLQALNFIGEDKVAALLF